LVRVASNFQPNNYLDVEGKDWATGYNLGATFQLSPSTRIGLAYRSKLTFDLKGSQSYAFPNASLVNQDITAKLTTPANFSMAVSQKLSDKWEMLGDVTWTGWDVVSTMYVDNQYSGAPLQKLPYNFQNTWRVGLGANYQATDAWKLRFGVAHDKSPVRTDADRTMTLPDSDRTWLSFGAKYSFTKAASMDFAYSHIFFAKASTARAVNTGYPGADVLRQTINGDFKASANILSLQYNHSF
jgi:long-chain fatty acid transport protein